MTTTQLAPTPVFKGWDNNGNPLAFGKLYSYIAGTTTPTPTYTDSTGNTPNTNPVILNARGEAPVWLNPAQGYKLNLTDSTGNQIPGWPVDNIIGPLNINQSLIPAADNTYDLGSTSSAWRQLYLGANHSPALDTVSGIIGYYPRTAAEIAAGVTPTHYCYPPYTLLRYGADPTGAADSTAAFQAAINCAQEANYSEVSVGIPGARLKVDGNLSINTNTCGFDGQGCFIDASGMTNGYLFTPTQTAALTGIQRGALNRSHPLRNFVALGPGSAVTAGFILFNDSSAAAAVPGITVKDGGSWDFQTHAYYENGAFFETFENWFFDTGGGGPGGTTNFVVLPNGTTNSGERNSFKNVRFGNSSGAAVLHENENAQTIFQDVSWNCIGTGGGEFISLSGGTLMGNGLHLESDRDNAYWVSVSGTNSICSLQNLEFVLDAAKTQFAVAYSDATVTWGKLALRDFQLSASAAYNLPLIAGTGNALVDNHIELGTAAAQPLYHAQALNVMADPIFASGTLATDGWAASGGAPPVIDSSNPYSGAHDVKFPGSGILTSRQIPCRPGQVALVQLQIAISNYQGGTLIGNIEYLDANGGAIDGGFEFMSLTANQAYTAESASVSGGNKLAPPGTVAVSLVVSLISALGTTEAFLGQCILTVA